MATYHRPDPPAAPVPVPSLADHARAWNPPEDPGLAIDRAINRARAPGRIRRDEDGARFDQDRVAAYEAHRRNSERERDEWNARYPIDQAIVATRLDDTSYRGRTTSAACLLYGDIPAIEVAIPGLPEGFPDGFWPLSRIEPVAELPDAPAAAAESERPGVLPVALGPEPDPDALAVLCRELGREFVALAEARRDGKDWDAGHWRRLRGAVEAAGAVLDAGPQQE